MGKIEKKATEKHEATLSPAIADFINTTTSLPLYLLPKHLETFPKGWPFPRGDIYHWIDALNRFDAILERFSTQYNLDSGPQSTAFTCQLLQDGDKDAVKDEARTGATLDQLEERVFSTEGDRELVESILRFSKLVFENCGNRSLYASTNCLSHLLNTTSLSLLEATLRLGLRCAQRYSASRLRIGAPYLQHVHQGLLATHYKFDLAKVEQLAKPFPTDPLRAQLDLPGKETTGIEMELLVTLQDNPERNISWQQWGEVKMDLREKDTAGQSKDRSADATTTLFQSPATPTPAGRSNLGKAVRTLVDDDMEEESADTILHIKYPELMESSLPEIIREKISKVPKERHYEFLHSLRVARALAGTPESRTAITRMRMLAIANLSHIYPESQLDQKVLAQEVEISRRHQLPTQLCNVIHPPGKGLGNISKAVQAVALETLDALCNHKNKVFEVGMALSINASHGTFTYIVRRALNEAAPGEDTGDEVEDREWRRALATLLHTLPKSSPRGGDGFLSAGLIEILTKAVSRRSARAEEDHPTILNFIDVWTYNTQNAFNEFVNAKGLDELAALLDYEVTTALALIEQGKGMPSEYKTAMTDYEVPFNQQQTLRALVKFLNHSMGFSGGATDRMLRNLIESSQLLGGLRTIISKPTVFGTNVWSAAVNVFGSFIHNEPTSYAAIAEAGLVKTFLETVTQRPADQPFTMEDVSTTSLIDIDEHGIVAPDANTTGLGSVTTYQKGVLASVECITALPQAFSAICLNEAGIKQLEATHALDMFYRALLSPAHVKALAQTTATEVENLGRDMDELARHHPELKAGIVFLACRTASDLNRIVRGNYMKQNHGPRICHLDEQGQPVCDEGFGVKIMALNDPDNMAVLRSTETWPSSQSDDVVMTGEPSSLNRTSPEVKKYLSVPTSAEYVTVFSKFMLGFFGNTQHVATFAHAGGTADVLNILFAPSLPLMLNAQLSSNRLVRVVQLLIDAKPHLVLPFMLDYMLIYLNDLAPFIAHDKDSAVFADLLQLKDTPASTARGLKGSRLLVALQAIQMTCSILTKCLAAQGTRSSTTALLTSMNLMDMYVRILASLGKLQVKCDIDRIQTELLWIKRRTDISSGENDLTSITTDARPTEHALIPPEPKPSERIKLANSTDASSGAIPLATLEEFNYRQVRHVTNETSIIIMRVFGGFGKALLSRRMPSGEYNKQNMLMVADHIAKALVDQLTLFLDKHEEKPYLGALNAAVGRLQHTLTDAKFDAERKGLEALTLILRPFKERGGLEILGRLAHSVKALYLSLSIDDQRRPVAATTLDDILSFFACIVDSKTIPTSTQSGLLTQRGEREREAAYQFSPMQLLVEVRMQVMRAVLPIWSADDIEKLPGKVIRSLASIIKEVLDARSENAAIQKRSHPAPKKSEITRRTWSPRNQAELDRLTERDYLPDLGREALYRCNDNQANALEYCMQYRRFPLNPRHPIPGYETNSILRTSVRPEQESSPSGLNYTLSDEATPAITPFGLEGLLGEAAAAVLRETAAGAIVPPQSIDDEMVSQLSRSNAATVTVEDLDELRNEIRTDLVDHCVAILDAFDNVTFEMADVIAASCVKAPELRQDITTTLLQSLISFQGVDGELSQNARKIARYAHLLGIITMKEKFIPDHPKFFEAALEELQLNFSVLLGFLTAPSGPQSLDEVAPWLAHILLILEGLLEEDVSPKQISWQAPSLNASPADTPPAIVEAIVSKEDKETLFTRVVDLLPRVGKDADVGIAFCRILALLTRDRQLAQRLGQKKNMQRFFVMLKQLSIGMDKHFRSTVMIILRHVVEDEETIRQYIRTEIKAIFDKPARIDTTVYLQTASHLVLRAPEIFVEVTNELLEIPKYDRNQTPQNLALKTPAKADTTGDATKPTPTSPAENATLSIEAPSDVKKPGFELKTPSVEHPDGVIQYLLSELMSYKDVDDKEVSSSPQQAASHALGQDIEMSDDSPSVGSVVQDPKPEDKKTDTKQEFKIDDHPIFVYRCFILQCLTELLASYNRTKVEFINFSRKTDSQPTTPSKPRSGVLNYLLNTLLPTDSVQHAEDTAGRKKSCVSSWAISVIVALCSRTAEKSQKKLDTLDEVEEPELFFVKRFVLEHALKAFKDANTSSEPFEKKGSKLLALADLFDRMLAGRPAIPVEYRRTDTDSTSLIPSQKLTAKMMFEKNFISALTSSVADLDLTLPGAKRVVKYVLRPLRLLTHTAIELSASSDSSTSAATTDDDDAISSASSTSEINVDREETPDFYRNSTLGMFEPGREEEEESDEEDEDEDGEDEDDEMYGGQYADDMDYDEEEPNDEDVVSDEDEEMNGIGPIEGLPGDMGMHIEVDMDGDDDDGDEMDEGSDDDDEDDDDGEDDDDPDDDARQEILEGLADVLDGESGDEDEDDEGWEDEGEDGEGMHDPMGFAVAADAEEVIELGGRPVGDEDESENDLAPYVLPTIRDPDLTDAQGEMEGEEDQLSDEDDGEEGEDDEDDYDEDEAYLNGGMGEFEMEDEDVGFVPTGMPAFAAARSMARHGGPLGYLPFSSRADSFIGGYRSHRPAGRTAGAEESINPLLDRTRQSTDDQPAQARQDRPVRPPLPGSLQGAIEMVLPAPGGPGATHDISALLQSLTRADETISGLDDLLRAMGSGVGGGLLPTIRRHGTTQFGHGAHHGHPTHIHVTMPGVGPHDTGGAIPWQNIARPYSSRISRIDPATSVDFEACETIARWREEAVMLCPGPGKAVAKATRVVNAILRLLVPPAIEVETARIAAAAKAREEERDRLRKEQEKAEQERLEQAKREEEAAKELAEQKAMEMEEVEATDSSAANTTGDAMEGIVSQQASEQSGAAVPPQVATPAAPVPRVMTTIRGQSLDITDLGIDLEFLDALPAELREDVIMQQVVEHRSQQAASGQASSTVDQEFLNALPVDIRAEVLQQEAADNRRREREENRRRASAANGGQARAEEMDPASFIATLDDPVLRQSLLAEADDDILDLLPPEVAAEARALGGHHRRRGMNAATLAASLGVDGASGRQSRTADSKALEAKPRRPIVQMLDKAGVATLLRLLFVKTHGSSRHSLMEIFRNACGNHQTRGEIISGLLSILQDGTADVAAVERAYTQLAAKATQPASVTKTPQSVKRAISKPSLDPSETSPNTVMDHCLHMLIFLTSSIPHIPKFFLTEHEALISAKAKGKGKGKAKDNKTGRYPLNSLLTLLDRDTIVDSPHLIELLASLLQMLTTPLTVLLKKDKADPTKDITSAEASSSTTEPAAVAADAAPVAAQDEVQMDDTKTEEKKKELTPPEIPEKSLRSIINVLTARECGGKTFRDTLSAINNLSAIPEARHIFGQELIKRAHQLATTIQKDLGNLIQTLKGAEDEMEAQTLALANFSPAGSDQAKLNRVLTALDYLFDPKSAENKKQSDSALEAGANLLAGLYEHPSFAALWQQLAACLSATQQAERYFLNVATILLPLIESLMVVCKGLTLKDARPLTSKGSAPTTPAPEPAMKNVFFTFTNRHKKILNDLVRQNPKLMSGSFSVLVKNPGVLEFDNKRNFFTRKLHYRTAEQRAVPHSTLTLNIRRPQVFGDSYRTLYFKKPEEIKYGKLNIRFHGEEGVDAGGVTREWFQVLARQMFNADNALFNPVAADRTTFHPNPLSSINEDHLKYFHFIGRIIGKALYENRVLDCHFSRAVYKRILGKSVSLKDMETIDLEYTKSLRWMLENDITDIITETFSVEKDNFGSIEVIDLIENGRNIPVTEDNKQEYVRLVMEYRLTGSVSEQLQHFLQGFHDIVPAELISIFDEGELELLISGMPEIDVDDWKNNTDYINYNHSSPQIQWFWRAVRSFDKEEQAKLLQFITGTGKVPLNGFKELEGMNGYTRFSIHKDYGDKDRLPSSHTCFNQLDLPEYENYEALRKNVYTAITTGGEYFGFA